MASWWKHNLYSEAWRWQHYDDIISTVKHWSDSIMMRRNSRNSTVKPRDGSITTKTLLQWSMEMAASFWEHLCSEAQRWQHEKKKSTVKHGSVNIMKKISHQSSTEVAASWWKHHLYSKARKWQHHDKNISIVKHGGGNIISWYFIESSRGLRLDKMSTFKQDNESKLSAQHGFTRTS